MKFHTLLISIALMISLLVAHSCRSRKSVEAEIVQTVAVDTARLSPEIRNELLIRFGEGHNLDAFTERHLDEGLELLRPLDQAQTMWLAGFDTLKVRPEMMIERLREDKDVVLVEFNKRLQMRR